VATATGLALAATGLAGYLAPAQAAPDGGNLVISEVYGAGGNSGAAYNADFVELYNPTDAAISLTGLAIHYRSATGGSGASPYALSGSVPAHAHWLIQMSATGSTGAALPTPDAVATPAFNMAAAGGQVALQKGTSIIATSGDVTGTAGLVDFFGGSGATSYEGAPATAAATATQSLNRTADGADTDNNAADFNRAAPTPENSGTDGGGGDEPPAGGDVTIAQIQGTGDISPLNGDNVTTEGVVTADYTTGGLNGFFLQTGGTGGTIDATPGASDAVFVYGANSAARVHIGDSVSVSGTVQEFAGETEISSPTVAELAEPLPAVTPAALSWADLDTDAKKEAHEGELLAPQGDFTVTDNYNTNFYGTVELAAGDRMLEQPTDVGTPGSAEARAAAAYNASHAIYLDDGSSWTYNATSHSSDPLPWLTPDTAVSDGAAVTFHQPVVLDYRNSQWNLQPKSQIVGDGSAVATFSDMRSGKTAPAKVGGDIRLATFNMENFFTTTGQQFVADNPGATCTYYNDRAGTPIGDNRCAFADGSAGPRGAATEAAYHKQLAKELVGIDGLGASIVSLEEVENSAKFGKDRDATIGALVAALNAKDGADTWAYIPSPTTQVPIAEQDVIRSGFIYKPADVSPVGDSEMLTTDSGTGQAFSIAREPILQAFKAKGAADGDAFIVVANHLKSKGADADLLFDDCTNGGDEENSDPVYDQGAFNCSRVHQAEDMWAWAKDQAKDLGTDKIFLVGDFNAYDHEDPIEYLYGEGFTDLAGRYDGEHSSYSYGGLEGSLDHVLASPAALKMVTGATIWQIDAQESVAFAYSRDNYNVTQLYDGSNPFATSDHDPEVVGLNLPVTPAAPAWDASKVYNTGDEVTYQGSLWKASWWTQNQKPGDPNGPWQEIVTAADGTAVWTPTRIFQAGDVAVYNGVKYKAKWYTRNQKPGDPYGPWAPLR